MATLATLQAQVADWLSADSTRLPPAVITDCLNFTQRRLLRKHDLRWGEFRDTFATVATQYNYALPADFSRPWLYWYLNSSGGTTFLNQIQETDSFMRKYPDPTKTGSPLDYHIYGAELWLGPTPGSIITINRTYRRLLADLAAGGDSNIITTNAPDLLLWGALTATEEYGIEDARMPLWQDNYQHALDEVLHEHASSRNSGGALITNEPG